MFILASLTLPFVAFTAFSRTGVSCLQGPHQGAQKSTSTGWRRDSSITSFMKPCVVVSLTRPSAGFAPRSCSDIVRFLKRRLERRNPEWPQLHGSGRVRLQSVLGTLRRLGHPLDPRYMAG